ncbi:MAG: hypothetical protein ACI3WR_00745 [Oscillospiraceae bacterium]
MKKYMQKKTALLCSMALAVLLALSACGENTPPAAATPSQDTAQDPEQQTDLTEPERTVSDTILLDGKETAVFLDISETEIEFWDSASGGQLLAVAKYPQAIPGAAAAWDSCDYTDLDGDGNSDMTAWFRFEDGTSASLVWFFSGGGFVYNEEFSQLPGSTASGD